MFNLIISSWVIVMVIMIIGITMVIYGNNNYMSFLDSLFSSKKNESMIWYDKGTRFLCYSLKYPFFVFKLKNSGVLIHLFMAANSLFCWVFIIFFIYMHVS